MPQKLMWIRGAAAGLALFAGPAAAHEFWISPQAFFVEPGQPLMADLRVGQEFSGSIYSYVPPNFTRFEVVQGPDTAPVTGRAGDRPALNQPAKEDGLAVIVHVTKEYSLLYTDWQKFVDFTEHKDFEGALSRHVARGLPQTGFRESYSRHAKSLMAVGDGAGADRVVGLETEIVAEANPYTSDPAEGMPVRVLYQGAPRADVQVELFARAPDGTVQITLHRTDANGRVTLPIAAGHEFLVDAVVLRELTPEVEGDPVWESLWASLTFAVPE